MGATLDALHRLQVIDNQLRSVRGQIESRKRVVHARQRKIAGTERELVENHQRILTAQSDVDRLELDRQTREQHMAKLRESLNKAKTNKEYSAVLTELNTDKADMTKLEERELAAMARVDELKQERDRLKAAIDEDKVKLVEFERALREVEARFADQIRDLEARRSEAADQVPPEALQTYERACERHEGEAMAMIERVHPRRAEYICTGCNMSVTLESVNVLQSQSRDELVQCHTCSRVLFLEAPAEVTV